VTGSPDSIHQRGRAAVLAGQALLDVPPGPGGDRWGLSLDVRLDPGAEDRLHALAAEAGAMAGPGQWLTGARGSSHLTVAYLERAWREVGADDPAVRHVAGLLRPLVERAAPMRWRVTGLALAERGVLALAETVDEAPDRFRSALLGRLGEVGRAEAYYRRSVWWATLVHFAAPLADPAALVDWVDERAVLDPVMVTAHRFEVVRYAFDGERTVPVPLVAIPAPGVPAELDDGAYA
jgi:hypothetical protein